MECPFKAAAVTGFQPMRVELAIRPLVLHLGPLELTLGAFECDSADHRPHGLVKLALRYLPILKLAALLPEALLQPHAPFPFFVGHRAFQTRQLAVEFTAEFKDFDGSFALLTGRQRIPSQAQFRMLS